tara:strand:+ start:55813 stop:56361 length:549 start_codon:yes stop_codon:yes gene_type:complete
MHPYKKHYTFKTENSNALKTKLEHYFSKYNFLFEEGYENQFIFFKKFSVLDAWKINPLHWESKVIITLHNETISIRYSNEGNGQITPHAFDTLFTTFFKNLEVYINEAKGFKDCNLFAIKKAKQKIGIQYLIVIVIICVFVFFGNYLKEVFKIKALGYFFIVIGGLFSLKLINSYWINKTTS